MNSVLVDTNVWVDIALKRPDFFEDSLGSVMACVEEGAQIFVVGTSVKDVFYWAERSAGAEAGYRALSMLFDIADVAVVDGPVCKNAVSLERPDYEDGIISACARAEQVEVIVSRDEAAFPLAWIGEAKFFPYVSKIDNGYGDRNLCCRNCE